jgi:hypothetical protein
MGSVTLPTFLGIGVPRAGTTWLHTLLAAHPDVYLPTKRKEVRFFDRHFDKGTAWYESYFPGAEEARGYEALGEISPQYLYCDTCPERIDALLPAVKLLVMLRHPVDRAYSQYGFVVQRKNYRGSFDEFLETRPKALQMGRYSEHLEAYRARFGAERILVVLFEEAIGGRGDVRGSLAGFLGVSVDGLPASTGRVNPSTVPRFRSLSSLAVSTGRRLRRHHLEPVVDLAGRLGLRRLLTRGRRVPRLDPQRRQELSARFEDGFDALERDWGLDLSAWRAEPSRTQSPPATEGEEIRSAS